MQRINTPYRLFMSLLCMFKSLFVMLVNLCAALTYGPTLDMI